MRQAFKSHRLYILISFFITLTVGLGVLITPIEKGNQPSSKFQTTEDGLWWAITTVTGVGYGDLAPTSTLGRIVGAILETAGVTSFGLIIAFITVNLMRKEQQFYWKRTTERFDRIERKLDNLEKYQLFIKKK